LADPDQYVLEQRPIFQRLLEVVVVKALATLVPHRELELVVGASELSNLLFPDLVDGSAQVVGFVRGDTVFEIIQLLQRDIDSRGLNKVSRGGVFFVEEVDARSLTDELVFFFLRVHPVVSLLVLEQVHEVGGILFLEERLDAICLGL